MSVFVRIGMAAIALAQRVELGHPQFHIYCCRLQIDKVMDKQTPLVKSMQHRSMDQAMLPCERSYVENNVSSSVKEGLLSFLKRQIRLNLSFLI